jgi:curved DNA-binding protein
MENFRDYYEILATNQGATGEEIKQAYRRLARKYHPDLNPGDKAAEEMFKLLNEAYEVLADPELRSQYDECNAEQWADFNQFIDQLLNREDLGNAKPAQSEAEATDAYQPGKHKTTYKVKTRTTPRDAEAELSVPLEKAYLGGRERIRLEDGRSLEVNMPPGMITGQRIRLRGQGVSGGDLYLNITVDLHPFFELDGEDILCTVPITPSEAALGATISIPTLDGYVKMNIPPGCQHGQKLRLASKGYPSGPSERGDQIVDIEIVIPTRLSPDEKAIYQELLEVESLSPRSNLMMPYHA